jgi:hypothetical protein
VYDGYLKKSPEKLTDNEKILYEKFFEEDLETEKNNDSSLFMSMNDDGDEESKEGPPKRKSRRSRAEEISFSQTFLNNNNPNRKETPKKIDSDTSIEEIKDEESQGLGDSEVLSPNKVRKTKLKDLVSSDRSSNLGVSEVKINEKQE